MSKEIKAWAFMAGDENGGKYFIKGLDYDEQIIYLKKPPAQDNPFDYGCKWGKVWEPTRILIRIED